jgi:uncharacterized protein
VKKILALADIHGRVDSLGRVLLANPDVSLVLVAGDLTNFGGAEVASGVLAELEAAQGSPAIALVPGNCDPAAVRKALEASGHSVDERQRSFPFCRVAGSGGGLRRAGITSFERTEEELRDSLEGAREKFADDGGEKLPLIVLTHSPPYGTNADLIRGTHAGSHAFADLMSSWLPALWVCGHIHESRCISLEDGTLVVNPGPCASGCYAVVEIQEGPGLPKLTGAYLSI